MPELIQDYASEQAERRPGAVAVVGPGGSLTYGALESMSNRIARRLRDEGCAPGDRVGLLMPKTPLAIAAILGIYKAGAIYVPLDPYGPPARLARIVARSGARCLLAARPAGALLDEIIAGAGSGPLPAVGWMDEIEEGMASRDARLTLESVLAAPDDPPRDRRRAQDPAHILFTSGSTGEPKGVVITHRNVIRFIEWAVPHFGIDATDRLSGHPPLQFDLSVFDIVGAFAAGAQLHLVPPEMNLQPQKLAEFIRLRDLTQWFSVPSVLSYMSTFDVVRSGDFPSLRRLLWCGEVFPTPALIHWMTRLPHVRFTNLYGPTEATIASSHYTLPRCPEDPHAPIPIGTACEGEELLILDGRLEPVPPGGTGDLYIGGVGLSPGYWNDPEKTREAFPADPRAAGTPARIYRTGDRATLGRDGLVTFVGRTDAQIKSRGYRIELGEVEAGVSALDEVRECAVVAIETRGFEGSLICCAYVSASDDGVSPVVLRKKLGRLVPGPMMPARWMPVGRLPRNGNGKIDRRRIREEFEAHETVAARQL